MKGCSQVTWGRCWRCRQCHHCWFTDVYRARGEHDVFAAYDGLVVRQCAHCKCVPDAFSGDDPVETGTPEGAVASRRAHDWFHTDGNDHRWAQRQRTHRSASQGRRQWNG